MHRTIISKSPQNILWCCKYLILTKTLTFLQGTTQFWINKNLKLAHVSSDQSLLQEELFKNFQQNCSLLRGFGFWIYNLGWVYIWLSHKSTCTVNFSLTLISFSCSWLLIYLDIVLEKVALFQVVMQCHELSFLWSEETEKCNKTFNRDEQGTLIQRVPNVPNLVYNRFQQDKELQGLYPLVC